LTHPNFELLGDAPPPTGRILPVYPLTEGLNQTRVRRIVRSAVESFVDIVEEAFPPEYLRQHDLLPIGIALREIHGPTNAASLEQARRRFIYQELFVLQLALALKRSIGAARLRSPALPVTAKIDARIRRLFPFRFTADQRAAVEEIAADMAREQPMNRLLQGDVGCGKTVVAEYAALLAVAHGCQAALMAPTEVLARQHAATFRRDLAHSRVRIAVLTGSLSAGQRKELLAAIRAGEADLIVGTHAVLQSDVEFARLGLVVIDEQHKFGVRQRARLKQAGPDPHYLVMTATPIPRTISMTLFGDLDVSTIRRQPPGRPHVYTYLGSPDQRGQWWEFFRKKLREGRQGYVIAPLVGDAADQESASVERCFEDLANGELEAFRLRPIHGRLSAAEKEAAMEAFRLGRTQVLVATSVVEVGIDVPNATVMTIEDGDRFGLAQLHQLRGRISRGAHPGYLCVFADAQNEESQRRLQAFQQSNDGFELAEIDFAIRGPGDLLSERQHGLPPLRIADLLRDAELLEEARRDARALVAADAELQDPQFARLRRMAMVRYGPALDLGDVG
jgi:ATP-dependent DNA helicase RecG